MIATTVAEKFMTLQEFIEFEQRSEVKHEYRNGKLHEMPGSRYTHNNVASEFQDLVNRHFKTSNKKCRAIGSDQKIYIPNANRGLFADVVVICGRPLFHDDSECLLVNPLLVVEVLSKSTQGYDKGDKFDLYRTLSSFREYVLVSQSEPEIQVRYLQDPENNLWKITNHKGLDASVRLHSIELELKLADIYSVVEQFTEEPE